MLYVDRLVDWDEIYLASIKCWFKCFCDINEQRESNCVTRIVMLIMRLIKCLDASMHIEEVFKTGTTKILVTATNNIASLFVP